MAEAKYGFDFNSQREKHGIPPLPQGSLSAWSRHSDSTTWYIPTRGFPQWYRKTIAVKPEGVIISETDTYLTGRKVPTGDPDYKGVLLDEEIHIRYIYSNDIPIGMECYATEEGILKPEQGLEKLRALGIGISPLSKGDAIPNRTK